MWKCQVAAGELLGLSSAGAQWAVPPATHRSQPVCMQHGAGRLLLSVSEALKERLQLQTVRGCAPAGLQLVFI